ncbi:MAG: carbohydrate ABC transporter permease [Synergistaceae bacterium]|jgi:ABC-type glycerol-3-phosphate transport system permease component|nr:carbohydrate ABC transporter permease [Synergistaceae bacterium]
MSLTGRIVTVFLVIAICFFAVFPFWWMVSTSFKPASEIYSYTPSFIPGNPTLDGYKTVFTMKTRTVDFLRWTRNSAICAFSTSFFGMLIACTGGYAISRFRFKGRSVIGYSILVAEVLPATLLILPLFMILSKLDMINSFGGLIIMYITFAVPFCTWMMKGFFDVIPLSLDEAALIDGASEFDVFFRVVLPLTLPGIAVTAFFSFIIGWNEYMFASICMRDYANWTFPVGLASFQGQYKTDWTIIMAGSVTVTLPIVTIFLALQKFLVGGMTAGAVKQ